MNGNTITVVGNLVDDPVLDHLPSGVAVVNFCIASTPRYQDSRTNEWKDGPTLYQACRVWRDQAENLAASLHKGDRVVTFGHLTQRGYTDRTGRRTVTELDIEEIAGSMRWATIDVTRRTRRAARVALAG
jgi:single-strand DNA-binding protein